MLTTKRDETSKIKLGTLDIDNKKKKDIEPLKDICTPKDGELKKICKENLERKYGVKFDK